MENHEQLVFWPIPHHVQDEWQVAQKWSLRRRSPYNEIVATQEHPISKAWAESLHLLFLIGLPIAKLEQQHQAKYNVLSALAADYLGIQDVVAAAANRPMWLKAESASAKGLLRKSRPELEHAVVGTYYEHLASGWNQILEQIESKAPTTNNPLNADKQAAEFKPSIELVEAVREGLQSHTINAPNLIEPALVEQGLSLISNDEIANYIAQKVWRLILSRADRALAEGKRELLIGESTGFADWFDHLILDRIPIRPKKTTPFLVRLYKEYLTFVGSGHVLPDRGQLQVVNGKLLCILSRSNPSALVRRDDLQVTFE